MSHRPLVPGGEAEFTELQNRAFDGSWGFCPNTTTEIIEQLNTPGCGHDGVILTYHGDEAVGQSLGSSLRKRPADDVPEGGEHEPDGGAGAHLKRDDGVSR